ILLPGPWTVPPSPEINTPRSYRSLAVLAKATVIRTSSVSVSELQMSLFRIATATTVVVTSLAVQECRVLGQVTAGNTGGPPAGNVSVNVVEAVRPDVAPTAVSRHVLRGESPACTTRPVESTP